jgi:hypothetical protein
MSIKDLLATGSRLVDVAAHQERREGVAMQ